MRDGLSFVTTRRQQPESFTVSFPATIELLLTEDGRVVVTAV